jgi:voltage-gated potassium channel
MGSWLFREMQNGTTSCNPRDDRARGICIVIDNDADNLYITVTARALNPNVKIITRAGQQRYANAIRNSGADEVIIPEYEGGLMTGRMIQNIIP